MYMKNCVEMVGEKVHLELVFSIPLLISKDFFVMRTDSVLVFTAGRATCVV